MGNLKSFSKCLSNKELSVKDKTIYFLYFHSVNTDIEEATPREIVQYFADAGFARPPSSRVKEYLSKDSRTVKVGKNKWRIKLDAIDGIVSMLEDCLDAKEVVLPESDDLVIPSDLLKGTNRKYLIEVGKQINGCYQISFFDSCCVMIRRLIEILIIEIYEKHKIENKIKDKDGNYYMLNDLIGAIQNEKRFNLGRNSKRGLNDAKWLGDQSAHSRRFLAKRGDIDKVQPNIRILVEELIAITGL